jgi:hypothetical protein
LSEWVEHVKSEITFEIAQIDRLFVVYADLLQRVQQRDPDTVEIAAVASVLHSFYNGLENIFMSVAKQVDATVPTGAQSHRDVLTQMTRATDRRGAVISKQTAKRLADYLGFRHFYRHSYSFFLDGKELLKLVTPLSDVWSQTRSELTGFMNSLEQER